MNTDHDIGHQPSPAPPSADLSFLHPDRVRLGNVGVFAGDWAWVGDPPRIPVGFVGVLVDRWNGWAVFRCSRVVAEAIVADQQRMRETERVRLSAAGITGDELRRRVDEAISPMWFDGDDIVCDESAVHGDSAVERHGPGDDGLYCVQGFNWCWIAVDPSDCDSIAGAIPANGQQQ